MALQYFTRAAGANVWNRKLVASQLTEPWRPKRLMCFFSFLSEVSPRLKKPMECHVCCFVLIEDLNNRIVYSCLWSIEWFGMPSNNALQLVLMRGHTVGGRIIQTLTYIHHPRPPEFQCYCCPRSMAANGRNKSNPWRQTLRHKTVTYCCPRSMAANGRNKSNPWRQTLRHKTVTYCCPRSMAANGRNKSNPWRQTLRHKTVTLKFRGAGGSYSSRI